VPEEALENSLARKNIRLMDVGLLHYEQSEVTAGTSQPIDRRFMVGCGIGFDAAVCEEALNSPIKDTLNHLGLGKLTYLGIALKQLIQSRLSTGRLTLDGEKTIEFDRLLFMVGMVHRYEGGGFMFCPHARDDDGLLDFCVVHDITKGRVLRLLPTAFRGKHLRFDEVEEYRAREALLESDIPLWVQTDGEVKTKATRIRLSILEEKMEFNY
jgi:diacylglycerol kinase family enzyme